MLTYKEGSEVAGKLLEHGASDVFAPPLAPEAVCARVASTDFVIAHVHSLDVIENVFLRHEMNQLKTELYQMKQATSDYSSLQKELQLTKAQLRKISSFQTYSCRATSGSMY